MIDLRGMPFVLFPKEGLMLLPFLGQDEEISLAHKLPRWLLYLWEQKDRIYFSAWEYQGYLFAVGQSHIWDWEWIRMSSEASASATTPPVQDQSASTTFLSQSRIRQVKTNVPIYKDNCDNADNFYLTF